MIETNTFKTVSAHAAAGRRTVKQNSVISKIALKIARRVRVQCAVYFIAFYIVSAIFAGSSPVLLLALVFPVISFLLSGVYGLKYGYISHYIAVPVILFLPASFIFFEKYAFLYALCYAITSLVAMTTGALLRQCSK